MTTSLTQLFKVMLENRASDLHITSGAPPAFRVHGEILKAKMACLSSADTKELCYSVMTEQQKTIFEQERQIDFSFGIRDLARFRANIYYQKGVVTGAFRHIPFEIPSFKELGLPPIVKNWVRKPRGLVLVTGPTGSGKSTSLACLINWLNETQNLHVITIEEPIEYIHSHRNCLINQREVGQDTESFSAAIKSALREDPDVVFVGEMRDCETVETALVLAETGHLVLSTLHTNNSYQSISRIVQIFPPNQQEQIRMQLSLVLEGVLTQCLLSRVDGQGRSLAYEILNPNTGIRNLIRENKLYQIPSAMMVGQEQSGMVLLNQTLFSLVKEGKVSPEDAVEVSSEPEDLIRLISQMQRKSA